LALQAIDLKQRGLALLAVDLRAGRARQSAGGAGVALILDIDQSSRADRLT
jgi:hypothetical protein